MKTWLKTDLAWAAGFVDGEGYLQIKRQASTGDFMDCVRVGQIDRDVLMWLASEFGGSVHVMVKAHHNTNQAWVWVLPGRKAERFVRLIYPYMRVKKQQARIFLEYRKSIRTRYTGNKPLTEIEISERMAVIAKMKVLNRRGINRQ